LKKKKLNINDYILLLVCICISFLIIITGCSENNSEIGIGPVKKLNLAPLNKNLSEKGKQIFDMKCIPCHRIDSKIVGPSLSGVTKRRKPEWIMNMILNPVQMTKENEAAKQLLNQYLVQMTYQNVSEDDAKAILEYFRDVDLK
jgi:cytochrome c551/c552